MRGEGTVVLSLNSLVWELSHLQSAPPLPDLALFAGHPGQPCSPVMCTVFTKCSRILASSFYIPALGKQVSFLSSHILSENIQSGYKIIKGKGCGDRVMAEAPSLSFSLATEPRWFFPLTGGLAQGGDGRNQSSKPWQRPRPPFCHQANFASH